MILKNAKIMTSTTFAFLPSFVYSFLRIFLPSFLFSLMVAHTQLCSCFFLTLYLGISSAVWSFFGPNGDRN